MRRIIVSILAAAACVAPAGARTSSNTTTFTVAGRQIEMPLPSGYCVPTGVRAEEARRLAAGDSQNHTPVDIQRCGTTGDDYMIVKYPRNLEPLPMTRQQFIEVVAAEFDQAALDSGIETGKNDVSASTGGTLKVDTVAYGPAGSDSDCYYLAGPISVANEYASRDGIAVSCLSIVGDRHLVIHAYNFVGSSDVAQMKIRVAQLLRSMRAK